MWHKINSAFLIFVFSVSQALWALPPVPAQYQYPSLVCGTPLPQPSATVQASLSRLYTQCLSQNCNQPGNYSGDLANKLAQAVFAEPQALITGDQSTIFCAFFGKQALDYVNCAYKLSARLDSLGADTCTTAVQQASPTPILGPNKAVFTLEQRTVQKVKELLFKGPGRFVGMLEGFAKNKFVQSLNCNSLTRTHSLPANTQTRPGDTASGTTILRHYHAYTDSVIPSNTMSISESLLSTQTYAEPATLSQSKTRSFSKTQTLLPTQMTKLPISPEDVNVVFHSGGRVIFGDDWMLLNAETSEVSIAAWSNHTSFTPWQIGNDFNLSFSYVWQGSGDGFTVSLQNNSTHLRDNTGCDGEVHYPICGGNPVIDTQFDAFPDNIHFSIDFNCYSSIIGTLLQSPKLPGSRTVGMSVNEPRSNFCDGSFFAMIWSNGTSFHVTVLSQPGNEKRVDVELQSPGINTTIFSDNYCGTLCDHVYLGFTIGSGGATGTINISNVRYLIP